ncbi:hypothetical protein F4776DRAFT_648365 [Hypoxylon sp. NC0597]|nr:hypothetical protein F4776DRAFT_648365 [Hypoxylon sp. NC0597]
MSVSSEARDIITRKKQQYCRFADMNQWQNMSKIALPEATYKFCQSDGSLVSVDGVEYSFSSTAEWVKYFSDNPFNRVDAIHLVGPGEFEQNGPDEVKAIFALIYHASMKGPNTESHHTGGGYYYETWKRIEDDWFLQELKLERTYFVSLDKP